MDINMILLVVFCVCAPVYLLISFLSYRAAYHEMVKFNVTELRRVVAEADARSERAFKAYEREPSDEARLLCKKLSAEFRYWRDRLREHEQCAADNGVLV